MLLCRRCPVCGRRGRGRCAECWAGLVPAGLGRLPAGVDRMVAVYDYDTAARALMLVAKNGHRRDLLIDFGHDLARRIRHELSPSPVTLPVTLPVGEADPVVTWVPANPAARRRRGYDQGRLLARTVASDLGLTAVPLLRRSPGPTQTGAGLGARRLGPRLRAAPTAVTGTVVLIDDVCTSGSSLEVGADRLRSMGADRVVGAVVARVA